MGLQREGEDDALNVATRIRLLRLLDLTSRHEVFALHIGLEGNTLASDTSRTKWNERSEKSLDDCLKLLEGTERCLEKS